MPDAQNLEDVLAAIAQQQADIDPPTGEKAIAAVYAEAPASVQTFPCFVNVEEGISPVERTPGTRRIEHHVISMHLLFGTAEEKYAQRSRRRWVTAVLDAFESHITRNGTCDHSAIVEVRYEPVTLGETEYVAATFVLNARLSVAIASTA